MVECADQQRGGAEEPLLDRSADRLRESVDDGRATFDRYRIREDGQQPRILGVGEQRVRHRLDVVPGLSAALGPKAAQRRAPQDADRQIDVSLGGDGLGEPRQLERAHGVIAHPIVEAAPDPGDPRLLLSGELQRLHLGQHALDDVPASRFHREVGRPQQPLHSAWWKFAQPRPTVTTPRRWARSATWSSSAATFSSVPGLAADKCQPRRSV